MPTEEQRLLVGAATDFLAKRAPIETLGEREHRGTPGPGPMWAEMADLGWLGLAIPAALGGSGGTVSDVELLAECLGAVLMPPPFLASAVAAAAALAFAAADPEAAQLLEALCAGSAVPVLAAGGMDGSWREGSTACEWNGQRLTGSVRFVEGAADADHFVVMARQSDQAQLVVVPRSGCVVVEEMPALVPGAWSSVRFDRATGTPVDGGWAAINCAIDHVAVAAAGWAAGATGELLRRTVDYVSTRMAFGAPVGSFQAVQHSMADCAIAGAEALSLSRRAATELTAGTPDAHRLASIAFVRSTSGLVEVSRRCHQVWGGIGFTKDAQIHHFSRGAKVLQHSWGGPSHHRRIIIDELRGRQVVMRRYRTSTRDTGER